MSIMFMLLIITYNKPVCQYIILTEVKYMENKLVINKKSLRGEDGYKTFSVRLKDETVQSLDALSNDTNRSRNELINILLDFAIKNCEVK